MPAAMIGMQTAILNGKIYAFGGLKGDRSAYIAGVERYDPATDTWINLKPMSTAGVGFSLAVLDGEIYVIEAKMTRKIPCPR